MTTVFIILALFGLGVAIFGYLTNEEERAELGAAIFVTFLIFSGIASHIEYPKTEPIINIPEEPITNKYNNPDTLLGYYKNDTLFIEYMNKHIPKK